MRKSERIAIFPGSFDPMTNGHLEIVKEAQKIFDKVIVAIGVSPGKKVLFTVEERMTMIREAISDDEVMVSSFSGLAVDYAKSIGAIAIVRGLRTAADLAFEMPMAMTNRVLADDIMTVFLTSSAKNFHISSSLVREVAFYSGDVSSLVPRAVLNWLQKRLDVSPAKK